MLECLLYNVYLFYGQLLLCVCVSGAQQEEYMESQMVGADQGTISRFL